MIWEDCMFVHRFRSGLSVLKMGIERKCLEDQCSGKHLTSKTGHNFEPVHGVFVQENH